jgi:hypothetical protein
MKKYFALFGLCCLCWMTTQAQEKKWAAGVRLGEPGGLTVRKYLSKGRNLWEFNAGTYGAFWSKKARYRNGDYREIGYSLNLMYLWQDDAPIFRDRQMKAYYGFGGQFNSRGYQYIDNGLFVDTQNLSLGGTAKAGLEYFLDDTPLSFFVEAGLYVEVLPQPVFLHSQGGAGFRFNF